MRKSEEIKRNFFNKKASDIHKYFPGNWTRPNDEVPYIRDGLISSQKIRQLMVMNVSACMHRRNATQWSKVFK